MKKIVIFLHSIQHGGIQRSLLEALNAIDIEKYDITIYAYSHNNPLVNSLPKGVKVIVDTDKSHYRRKFKSVILHIALLFSRLFKYQKGIDKYSGKIREFVHKGKAKYPAKKYFPEGIDVAISYAMGICTQMAVEVKSDKKYVFFHSSDPNFHRDLSDKYFDKFDNIVAVGANVQKMLKENFPHLRERIGLIKNYIDPNDVKKLSDEYDVDISKHGHKTIISSVIRVDKEKGADLIVSAADKLKRNNIPYVWYIVGDGASRNDIEKQIFDKNLEDEVILVGFKDNPYPYVKCCDIFVHPAYEESFGLSILEALILGKAIVSTETMGAKEVLNNGEYGILTPLDSDLIANAVQTLIMNPEIKRNYESAFKYTDNIEESSYKKGWEIILNGGKL